MPNADAAALLAGLRRLADRARAAGMRTIVATLPPYGGYRLHTPQREAVRLALNADLRTGGYFDALVDFDAALRDPLQPDRLRPAFDSGDHLHPNDAGYHAIADAVILEDLI